MAHYHGPHNQFPLTHVNIYPPIGIARVGNSPDGWYYGPEIPDRLYAPGFPDRYREPEGGFKDGNGAIKRQAARFRVFGKNDDGKWIEANKASGYELVWKIQLANKKASWYKFMGRIQKGAFQPGYTTLRNPEVQADAKDPNDRTRLIVDSGPHVVRYGHKVHLCGNFFGSKEKPTEIHLGDAWTDGLGRLVVLAGHGESKSIAHKDEPYPYILSDFDNPDWIDDTSDGLISVQVRYTKNHTTYHPDPDKAVTARIIGTTPKFANGIYAPTTLYDLMEEIYEREKRKQPGYDVGLVDWYEHIWPLLRRPSLLSWVNIKANGQHGPNGLGNFFDQGWQMSLSDNTTDPDNEAIRKGVLCRMRLPETDTKYDPARNGQAFKYFMPWLSGDGGRTVTGDPSTFSSVTKLQYDRLVKWSEGDFTKNGPTTKYKDFDEIPENDKDPAYLTEAALEATIGAPLYPGIELSWNAEESKTYDLSKRFTIRDDVQPGDLTKYLSLPWQSGFYECRTYWWPSVRPDTIVTEKTYERVRRSVKPPDVAKNLTHRVTWDRDFLLNYTDKFPDQPRFANTDMAENWYKLGFIVQRPSFGPDPIFVERERGQKKCICPDPSLPDLPIPKREHPPIPSWDLHRDSIDDRLLKWLRELLQNLLRQAMEIELTTIPLYLFAMYSIKIPAQYVNDPRYYDPISGAILNVVAEEMLHLSLAGNVLRAIGGRPKLYDVNVIPHYPKPMPYHSSLTLCLREGTKENIETFVQVEERTDPNAKDRTIGQFYASIEEGLKFMDDLIKYLNRKGIVPKLELFYPETAKYQFAPGLGYQARARDAGGFIVVKDLPTALQAINEIVYQGEGIPEGDSIGPDDDKAKLEKDHYDVFLDLNQGDSTWETYPVWENPVTHDYLSLDKRLYHVSLTFDAAYCFLLRTIETLWYIDREDERYKLVLGNLFSIMMGILKPLAQFLVTQPIGTEGRHAAPCFGYYDFGKDESELKQLKDEMQATINSYLCVTAETPDQVPVTDYGSALETLLPIQTSIKALVELPHVEG